MVVFITSANKTNLVFPKTLPCCWNTCSEPPHACWRTGGEIMTPLTQKRSHFAILITPVTVAVEGWPSLLCSPHPA